MDANFGQRCSDLVKIYIVFVTRFYQVAAGKIDAEVKPFCCDAANRNDD